MDVRSVAVALAVLAALAVAVGSAPAATYTVTSAADSGAGSLREAIANANGSSGSDTIMFAIPAAGAQSIVLSSELPGITSPVVIDGWSQGGAGYTGPPLIEINGSATGSNGLTLGSGSDGSTLRGLVVNRFSGHGIVLHTQSNRIYGNWIGITAGGVAAGNGGVGVEICDNPGSNVIGTNGDGANDAAEHNVISANGQGGVRIANYWSYFIVASNNNVVAGNLIGTAADGTTGTGYGNGAHGVQVIGTFTYLSMSFVPVTGTRIGTDGNGVGDADEGNVIAGSYSNGISLGFVQETVVAGNFIGTDRSHTASLGNSLSGVALVGGNGNRIGGSGVSRNYIAHNGQGGVNLTIGDFYLGEELFLMWTYDNQVTNNEITSNGSAGIFSSVTTSPENTFSSNVIEANGGDGVVCWGSSPVVTGNTIRYNVRSGVNSFVFLGPQSFAPDSPWDDVVSRPSIGGTGGANTITGNCTGGATDCAGIFSLDTAPANEATLEVDNTVGANNGAPFAEQRWYGAVEVIRSGAPVASSVTFDSANGGPSYTFSVASGPCGAFDGTTLHGTVPGLCDDLTRWPQITEYVVTDAGTRVVYVPETSTAPGAATFSFDGNAATEPTNTGAGFNAEGVDTGGLLRYQVVEITEQLRDLAVAKSHAGDLFQGQGGATYTITVSSVGGLTTAGEVTVVDTLPEGLAATALSGTGWTCEMPTLTCTRSDALASGSSYEAITLTVDVSPTCPASVTNSVTVSGGGDVNPANDTATDATTVEVAADLAVAVGASPDPVGVGAPLTYAVELTNLGPSEATGVTVSDALPAGTTYVSASGTGFACAETGSTVSCTAASLPVGTASLQVVVTAPAALCELVNTVTVSAAEHDADGSNDTATVTTDVATLLAEGLVVDGTGNGVLEPGETVAVEPAWHNVSTAALEPDGAATDMAGPDGAVYTIADGTADYGTVDPDAVAACLEGDGCYQLGVSTPATRPAAHWDATVLETLTTGEARTWTLHVGASFSDVTPAHSMYRYVETLLHSEVTTGCGGTEYCPSKRVTRSQMAMFLARAMAGSDAAVPASGTVPDVGPYECQAEGRTVFTDVAPTSSYCRHVHYIAAHGVTLGCTTSTYCPGGLVRRGAMSMFVARAMAGGDDAVPVTYLDPDTGRVYSCDPDAWSLHFSDVPLGAAYCRHAHYLWARGVIDGCAAGAYCPSGVTNRAQMAKFLTNAFSLELYGH